MNHKDLQSALRACLPENEEVTHISESLCHFTHSQESYKARSFDGRLKLESLNLKPYPELEDQTIERILACKPHFLISRLTKRTLRYAIQTLERKHARLKALDVKWKEKKWAFCDKAFNLCPELKARIHNHTCVGGDVRKNGIHYSFSLEKEGRIVENIQIDPSILKKDFLLPTFLKLAKYES